MKNFFALGQFTSIGFNKRIPSSEHFPNNTNLRDQVFIITGANSGIGFETAKVLLQMHAKVIIICRNEARMNSALEQLNEVATGEVSGLQYDLSDSNNIDQLIQDIKQKVSLIDCFIHNAGALLHQREVNSQGIETTFASMTLTPFKLTQALMDMCRKFIWVSSGGMYGVKHNLADINFKQREFDGVLAYAESKRNQVDLAMLFSQKFPTHQFFSMHPGWVDTPGVQKSLPTFRKITRLVLRSYYQGCDTILYLATQNIKEKDNGSFWFDRQVAPQSLFRKGPETSKEQRQRLWNLLESL